MWPLRATQDQPAPDPGGLVYVIADIHGCYEALIGVLELIQRDANGRTFRIVTLGDYIDRGPNSADVLTLLHEMGDDVFALIGNHEQMLLDFLDAPESCAERWLSYGGEQTLRSFGVSVLLPPSTIAEQLRGAMGDDLVDWIRRRPVWWQSGNLIAVHAQTDPGAPMDRQSAQTLLWARPPRKAKPRDDGAWVVHGHTVVPEPVMRAGHIAIDQGAGRGNPLIAAVFDSGTVRFLSCPQNG